MQKGGDVFDQLACMQNLDIEQRLVKRYKNADADTLFSLCTKDADFAHLPEQEREKLANILWKGKSDENGQLNNPFEVMATYECR